MSNELQNKVCCGCGKQKELNKHGFCLKCDTEWEIKPSVIKTVNYDPENDRFFISGSLPRYRDVNWFLKINNASFSFNQNGIEVWVLPKDNHYSNYYVLVKHEIGLIVHPSYFNDNLKNILKAKTK